MKNRFRLPIGLGVAGIGALALGAAPVGAHIHAEPHEVPAGGSAIVSFTTGHGCDGSPTDEIRIQIPEGINSVNPQWLAGWDAAKTMEDLPEPIEQEHGDPLTERVAEITFTAQPGNELPDGQRGVFTIAFTAPDTPGETLAFPIVQGCVEGETAWIEETVEGEEEPESPAPVLTIGVAAEDGHGDDAAASDGDEGEGDGHDDEAAADDTATTEAASADDDADSGGSDGLAIAGLAMGAAGLAAGGAALARTRSKE